MRAAPENRTRETNVGNLVTDAFRRATGADVALMNGGSIRADTIISPGTLDEERLAFDSSVQEQGSKIGVDRRRAASGTRTWRGPKR